MRQTGRSDAMIADPEEMRAFVAYLEKQVDDLIVTRKAAEDSMKKMTFEGNDDVVFQEFCASFAENAKFIDILNELLNKSAGHYTKLAALVREHLETRYKGNTNY